MKSKLFDYLKDKASNEKTKDKMAFNQRYDDNTMIGLFRIKTFDKMTLQDGLNYQFRNGEISFENLYKLVQEKINIYNDKQLDKTPYLMVFNDTNSIANVIALLSLGYSPILIDGFEYAVNWPNSNDFIIDQQNYFTKNNIISDYTTVPLNMKKFNNTFENIKKSTIVYEPIEGSIGIFSSGSEGNPKIVFVDENKIINNVLKSKFNNRHRSVYNTTSIGNISGLTTNVFMPLVLDDCDASLTSRFNFKSAVKCTDIYVPRNYQELLPKEKITEKVKIKKMFIFGGINNLDLVNAIRNKIELGENVFVSVYGCTECGGLVSEMEEKDFDELSLHKMSIEGDSILYTFIYPDHKSESGIIHEGVRRDLIREDVVGMYGERGRNGRKTIPCGLLSEGNLKISGKTIGEVIIGDYHTGDVGVVFHDKVYIIGRKNQLEKNQKVGGYDTNLSADVGLTCTTFTNEFNQICVAVKYTLRDNNIDGTMFFRRLIGLKSEIGNKIIPKYDVEEIIFLIDDQFTVSDGLKKPLVSSIKKYLDEGRNLNKRLMSFEDTLRNHICDVCNDKLGFIPKFRLTYNNIIFKKEDISLKEIAQLLNDLSIVLIDETEDEYYIYYDDRYYFDSSKGKKYTIDEEIKYEKYAESNLLIEQLALDNKEYAKNLSYKIDETLKDFKEYIVYYKEGHDRYGHIILIPYFYTSYLNDYETVSKCRRTGIDLVEKITEKKYPNIYFTDFCMRIPSPAFDELGFLTKVIYITDDGYAYFEKIEDAYDTDEVNYFCSVIARMYNKPYNNYNKYKIKTNERGGIE